LENHEGSARRRELMLAPIDLGNVVSEALGLLRMAIPGGVGIEVAISPDLDLVLADEVVTHQLLIVLVKGCARSLGGQGSLSVSLDRVELPLSGTPQPPKLHDGRYLCLGVEVRGAHRPHEVRLELDLVTVHDIVERHGGGVVTDRSADKQPRIRCFFPAYEGGPVSGEAKKESVSG
jgi:hypothetical protein